MRRLTNVGTRHEAERRLKVLPNVGVIGLIRERARTSTDIRVVGAVGRVNAFERFGIRDSSLALRMRFENR